MTTNWRSCLYEGTVRHRRFAPIEHSFTFPLFLVYVALDEIEPLFGRRGLWSSRWPALARFCREDYFGDPKFSLGDCVRDFVERGSGRRPTGPIGLLTSFRYLGFAMNPVNLYYCHDASGERVKSIIAEVNNTPWNEKHCYLLDFSEDRRMAHDSDGADAVVDRILPELTQDKVFHVSPFMPLQMRYRWRISEPRDQLSVHIESCNRSTPEERAFDATLTMTRRPITRRHLAQVVLRYPAMTAQVFAGIYWQAFRLWMKGVPFYSHPKHLLKEARPEDSVASSA